MAVLAGGSYTVLGVDYPPALALYRAGVVSFFRDLGGLSPHLMQAAQDGRSVAFVGLARIDDACRLDEAAVFAAHLDDLATAAVSRGKAACLPSGWGRALAVNGSGTRAVALVEAMQGGEVRAFGVDLVAGTSRELPLVSPASARQVVWTAGRGFLVLEGGGLRALSDDGEFRVTSPWTDRLAGLGAADETLSIAAEPGAARVAVGTRDGRGLVLDTTPWPPVAAVTVPAGLTARGAGSEVTALAFLSGGAGLAVVQPVLATVRLLAFKGALVLPVAGLELPSPQSAIAIEDGTLRVSGENKVLVASQATGAVIESVRLYRRMSSPQFVRSPCDAESSLAVVSQGIGYVEERSPQSLTLTRCALRAELPTAGARGAVTELAGSSDARVLFLAYEEAGLARERPGEDPAGPHDVAVNAAFRLSKSGGALAWTRRAMSLSLDARTLVVTDAARGKVLVFDAAASDFATRAPYELDVGNDVVRALADDEGRVVVVRSKRVFVFDAARARAGEASVVGAFDLPQVHLFDLARLEGAAPLGSYRLDAAGALADLQLSPNGTEAYALLNGADGSGWLQVTDAANGRLSSVVLPIGGSDGVWFSHLAVSGSGQRVVAVDAYRNVVAAFE
jgi:DNA-binding beta-propeller fold protein YncE